MPSIPAMIAILARPLPPEIEISGAFFPESFVCLAAGLLFAVITWTVFRALNLAPNIKPGWLVYPCLTALAGFACWLLLFSA